MSYLKTLYQKNLIDPPKYLIDNVHYEIITGSVAYGVSNDTSDMDIYGFAIPNKEVVFPHTAGYIYGFGSPSVSFEQFQKHHIEDKGSNKNYDMTMYNIVKYFYLCMDSNPNMIDTLFIPDDCILTITKIGNMVRDNRKIFLSKKSYHKFKGYAYSQMHKIKSKNPEGSRKDIVEKYGYDVKFAYHVVRLIDEIDQILTLHDLDLRREKERMKAVRSGEFTLSQIEQYFSEKEKYLEKCYENSTLPNTPQENKIKELLLNCLEEHYGDLSSLIKKDDFCPRCEQIKQILK